MQNLHSPQGAIFISQILVSAFLGILFLQSGLDKVLDRRGNLEWLTGHFAKSPLAGQVPFLLHVITFFEVLAGALSAVGCVLIIFSQYSTLAYLGAAMAGMSIVALFLGQRLAKDYAGAAVLVPYFILTLAGIYILA